MKSRLTTDEAKVLLVRNVAAILERVATDRSDEQNDILAAIVLAAIEAGAYASTEADARDFMATLNKRSAEIAHRYGAEPWLMLLAQRRDDGNHSLDSAGVRHSGTGTTGITNGITIRNGV